MAEKKEHLIEITYHETKKSRRDTLETDDLAWSMNQYQRNRQPLTWELLDEKNQCHLLIKPYTTETPEFLLKFVRQTKIIIN